MATAHAPYLLRGKIGQHIFRVRDGKQQTYLAPFRTNHDKAWNRTGYNDYRKNIEEFTAAAAIGGTIYRKLRGAGPRASDPDGPGHVFRPYAHNLLTARIKKFADHADKVRHTAESPNSKIFARQFRIRDAVRALQGLDLGHDEAPREQIHLTLLGPQHNPEKLRIHGLREAAAAIGGHGNAHIEFRVRIRQSCFPEHRHNEQTRKWEILDHHGNPCANSFSGKSSNSIPPSEWIPAQIVPDEGITLDIPKWENHHKYLTAVFIEWREVRAVGNKTTRLHQKAIVRIACLHGPAEAFLNPDKEYIDKLEARLAQPKEPAPPQIDWRTHPEDFLRSALARFAKD